LAPGTLLGFVARDPTPLSALRRKPYRVSRPHPRYIIVDVGGWSWWCSVQGSRPPTGYDKGAIPWRTAP
ncbi:MAG TPA: hypothetical protein VMW58_08960, partial [Anaerolineae bacterium]|nr:hypothetical protein [Anaerolineae bacterium]